MPAPMLKIEKVGMTFPTRRGPFVALRDIDLVVGRGEQTRSGEARLRFQGKRTIVGGDRRADRFPIGVGETIGRGRLLTQGDPLLRRA